MRVAAGPRYCTAILVLLGFDGAISALAGALLLPTRLGGVPLPYSALLSGLVNALLVWSAAHYTESLRVAALPLWTWLATVAVLTLGGPGNDVVLSGNGVLGYSALILLVLGVSPPVLVLRRLTAADGPR